MPASSNNSRRSKTSSGSRKKATVSGGMSLGSFGIFVVPALAATWFALDKILNKDDLPQPPKKFDLENKKLYSFDKKETHCPGREMIHPCTTELRRYLKENDASGADSAYECAKTVYEMKTEDFYTVKNMTHLLLDLDATDHHFDKENNRENRFYQLGLDFGKKLLFHPDCMQDFDDMGELQCRCPMLYGKILLLKLKNAGRWDEAEALFDELKAYEWKGQNRRYKKGEAFRWDSIMHTPQIYIPNLYSKPVWGEDRRNDLPIWDVLENNFDVIREEALAAFNTSYVEDTYRFLFKDGNWNQITLAHNKTFTEACERVTPRICDLVKKSLPARKVHHYPWTSTQNEQVLLLKMQPGTEVELHSGPANNILNVHLGISGLEGALLTVANETYAWQEGKVIAWDGSYDHTVDCRNCKEDRIIMMVRYMHPDMTPEHYRGNERTHHEEIPPSLFEENISEQAKVTPTVETPSTPVPEETVKPQPKEEETPAQESKQEETPAQEPKQEETVSETKTSSTNESVPPRDDLPPTSPTPV